MALDMYTEINGTHQDWEKIKKILYELGLKRLPDQRPDAISGSLGNNAVFCEAAWDGRRRRGIRQEIIAEAKHACNFIVNIEIDFRINNALYEEAVEIIKRILTRMAEETDVPFVLSFQYEEVRAIRDNKRGFQWLWANPIALPPHNVGE